jgi:hypothetical protein
MQKDPLELTNLNSDENYQQIKENLKSHLLDWYVATSDVVPFKRDDRSLPKMTNEK